MLKLRIKEELHSRDKTVYWLGQHTMINLKTLYKYVNGDINTINIDVVNKIADVLEVRAMDLLEES